MGMKLTRCHGCGSPTMFTTNGPEGADVEVCLTCRRYWTSPDAAPQAVPKDVLLKVEWEGD